MANTSTLDIKVFENVHGLLNNLTGTLTKANTAVVSLTSSVNILAGSFSKMDSVLGNTDKTVEKTSKSFFNFFSNAVKGINTLGTTIRSIDTIKNTLDQFSSQATNSKNAMGGLMGIISKAKNPWVLLGLGIAGVGLALYNVMTRASETTKHYKKLNESLVEMEGNVMLEEISLDRLFGKLKNTKEGTEEWNKARDEISDKYGEYLDNLGIEIRTAEDAKKAYDALKKSILEVNRIKFVKQEIEGVDSEYVRVYAESMGKIRDTLIEYASSREEGMKFFDEFIEKFETGEEYSEGLKNLLQKRTEGYFVSMGDNIAYEGTPKVQSDINTLTKQIKNAQKHQEESLQRIVQVYKLKPEDWGLPIVKNSATKAPTVNNPQQSNTFLKPFTEWETGESSSELIKVRDHSKMILSSPSVDQQLWSLPHYKNSYFNSVTDPTKNREVNIKNELTVNVSNSSGQSGEILGTQFAQAFVKEVSESLTALV